VSLHLIKYVLTAAIRDKLFYAVILLMIIGSSLPLFLGSSAVIEQGRFSLVFAAGGLRFAGVLVLVLFVVNFVRRSFDSKDVDFLLSRPISRIQFLFSFAAAFTVLAVILGLAIGLSLYALGPELFGEGHLLWAFSIIIEYIIMANAALFVAMALPSATVASVVCFAFYVLARMMGTFLGIVDANYVNYDHGAMNFTIQFVSTVMPRLDLMGQTAWLIYGVEERIGYGFLVLQGLFFTVIVLSAAMIDLLRREF